MVKQTIPITVAGVVAPLVFDIPLLFNGVAIPTIITAGMDFTVTGVLKGAVTGDLFTYCQKKFGLSRGEAEWDEVCDVNQDGDIGIDDIMWIGTFKPIVAGFPVSARLLKPDGTVVATGSAYTDSNGAFAFTLRAETAGDYVIELSAPNMKRGSGNYIGDIKVW